MKALTIWQPWASLINIGAKPFEFRRWPAPKVLIGQRVVIHAGARAVRWVEVADLLARLGDPAGGHGLNAELARPLLLQVLHDMRPSASAPHRFKRPSMPLAAGLGTAILGDPIRCIERPALFGGDSARIDEHVWAWPLAEVEPFGAPIPAKGAQGFWDWGLESAQAHDLFEAVP